MIRHIHAVLSTTSSDAVKQHRLHNVAQHAVLPSRATVEREPWSVKTDGSAIGSGLPLRVVLSPAARRWLMPACRASSIWLSSCWTRSVLPTDSKANLV
jgi:hypothetical protein